MKKIQILVLVTLFIGNACVDSMKEDENDSENNVTITDYEGNSYKTIAIGSQIWMAENLKTTHYNNGEEIPTSPDFPINNTQALQYPAGNNEDSVAVYGRLYTYAAISDSRGVCPNGWHIPSDDEWIQLESYLDSTLTQGAMGNITTNAGGKLKEAGYTHWKAPNVEATNESGFNALPAGVRASNGFSEIGNFASFWTSTQHAMGGDSYWCHELNKNNNGVYHMAGPGSVAKSVRCIKNNE